MSGGAFDPSPLTAPVDRAALRDFARGAARTPGQTAGLIAAIVGLAFAGFVMMAIVVVFLVVLASFGGPSLVVLLPGLLIAALITGGVILAVRAYRGAGERAYRLAGFARANGLTYAGTIGEPPLPGLIFGHGANRTASHALRGTQPRFVEFANYRYTTGSGKERRTHTWSYVAIKLDVPLPHIVLDALGNNGLFGGSNLPIGFDRDQRLSLEGDFDRYFALFCPAGYERDALYLFTPDVMARFVDNAAALDVEIVDDWLFLYSQRDLVTLDPATWAWLFATVGALLDKLTQWARWRDERLATALEVAPTAHPAPVTAGSVPFAAPAGMLAPPPGVAVGGRRLRRRFPWVAIVVGVVFAVGWMLLQSGVWGVFLR